MANALKLTKPHAFSWQQIERKTQQMRDYFGLLTRNAIYVSYRMRTLSGESHAVAHHCHCKKMQHGTEIKLFSAATHFKNKQNKTKQTEKTQHKQTLKFWKINEHESNRQEDQNCLYFLQS